MDMEIALLFVFQPQAYTCPNCLPVLTDTAGLLQEHWAEKRGQVECDAHSPAINKKEELVAMDVEKAEVLSVFLASSSLEVWFPMSLESLKLLVVTGGEKSLPL